MEEVIEVSARPLTREEATLHNRQLAYAYYIKNREEILASSKVQYREKTKNDILKHLQPIRLKDKLKRQTNDQTNSRVT